jgi:hypothetical protein
MGTWPCSNTCRRGEATKQSPQNDTYFFALLITVSRYGKVIAVVGMNLNKKYLVSPEERVQLIRLMVSSNVKLNNVKAQGTRKHADSFQEVNYS